MERPAAGGRGKRDTKTVQITCRDDEGITIRLPEKPDGKRPGRRRVQVIVDADVVVTAAKRWKKKSGE